MHINKHLIRYNHYQPHWVIVYIKERVANLANLLDRRVSPHYSVSFEQSSRSEACYITIQSEYTNAAHTISFRNHKTNGYYDTIIWLSEYKTWSACKQHFLKNKLPDILLDLARYEQPINL